MKAIEDRLTSLSLFIRKNGIKRKELKKEARTFMAFFSNIPDMRNQSYTKYKLENILGICFVMALMGKFTSFHHVEQYVKLKPRLFISLKLVEKGKYPSNDTYMRVFSALDNRQLTDDTIKRIRLFMEKAGEAAGSSGRRMISGDGQVIRGSFKGQGSAVNMFNLYDVSSGIVMTSVDVESKTNEIPVLQQLLKRFSLRDAVVTADALHCQAETVRTIIGRKGHYCFPVKDNQKSLNETISRLFSARKPDDTVTLPERECIFIRLRQGEISPEWEGAKTIVMSISSKREKREKRKGETMYFLTSLTDPQEIAEAIEMRWQIENGLHRFKDVQLHQDEISVRDRNALRNMATMSNIVYSLYRIAASVRGESPQQTKIIFEDNPMGMLTEICPLLFGNTFTMLVRKNMRGTKESKK